MQYNNKSALSTPLINRVVYLNKQLVEHGRKLPHGKARRSKYTRNKEKTKTI